MSKGTIVIVDLGHENCQLIKSDVEQLGASAVICDHDVSRSYLDEIGPIAGLILNGGPNKNINGFRPEASDAVYESELPIYAVDHASMAGVDLFVWPEDTAERQNKIRAFLVETCGLEL
ncbi:MAG: hypothetical protein RR313_08615 [Anaerovoracaceae bacterium]